MSTIFRKILARKDPAQTEGEAPIDPGPPFTAPLSPDHAFAAIGDIHGCFTLLEKMVTTLRADFGPELIIVTVGDYIDRGEQSREVLEYLFAEQSSGRVGCLIGNHEDMMIDFLDTPEESGPRWLRNGGLQTLASFGVGRVTETSKGPLLVQARDQLRAALGPIEPWLRDMPDRFQTGNVAVVHAGADPDRAMDAQRAEDLMWGHRLFRRRNRSDGVWVVHGHTTVPEVEAIEGRIAVDTGAYATRRLSAAVITPDQGLRVVEVA